MLSYDTWLGAATVSMRVFKNDMPEKTGLSLVANFEHLSH